MEIYWSLCHKWVFVSLFMFTIGCWAFSVLSGAVCAGWQRNWVLPCYSFFCVLLFICFFFLLLFFSVHTVILFMSVVVNIRIYAMMNVWQRLAHRALLLEQILSHLWWWWQSSSTLYHFTPSSTVLTLQESKISIEHAKFLVLGMCSSYTPHLLLYFLVIQVK